jgi:hypothetical protein
MRFQKPLCLIAAAGLMTAVAPLASGQLAPPPPPAGDPEPEYVPPARPAPAPAREAQPERPRSSRPTLPELPHAPLWCPFASIPGCVDYDGEVPEYERSIHIMALTRNPATTPSQVADFLGMIAKRRVDLEPRVIENLETLYEVEAGLIDQVSLTDVEGLRMITEQIEPLVAQPYLTQDLRSKGLLSRVQADWNDRLIREYQTKLGEQWQRERPDEANDLILRFIFDDSVAEAKEAYDGMLLEIALRPDEILDELGIPEENDAALRALSADLPSLQNTRRGRASPPSHQREQDHVADRHRLIGQQHHQAVDAEPHPARRRHADLERVDEVRVERAERALLVVDPRELLAELRLLHVRVVQLRVVRPDLHAPDEQVRPLGDRRGRRLGPRQRAQARGVVHHPRGRAGVERRARRPPRTAR